MWSRLVKLHGMEVIYARSSLDACARLQAEVLPGSAASLEYGPDGGECGLHTDWSYTDGRAPTLPRAWLAAILRALAEMEG